VLKIGKLVEYKGKEKAGLQFTRNSGYSPSPVFIKILTIKKYRFIFEMCFKGFPRNKSPEIKKNISISNAQCTEDMAPDIIPGTLICIRMRWEEFWYYKNLLQ
jgi:hypothetical protein